jgi:AcrR family transcriptional regulator
MTVIKTEKKDVVYGRPRLLTHDEIIKGALELGLEGLTMKQLANHLNVGTATLYQYWDNRVELMRAAAVHALADLSLPDDNGQHWSNYAYEFALCLCDYMAANPSLVITNHVREYGFEVQFQLAETFLTAMERRGFAPDAGMQLFNLVGSIIFAGAVERIRESEFAERTETAKDVAKRHFDRLDQDKYPLFGKAMDGLTISANARVENLARAAFRSVARERGEPEDAILAPS